ncbi:hypothetical protein HPB50_013179 [Hyalomma asiaticum]|uniref:Uncharacterized protein n=1 Tax=Hyalomma asiaticum TaxID=266040 RepID=A0ACB7S9E9_HYAAI|nr:hypothetical protein HPB50_013179 [Hyalomma asiaticum]
MSHLLVGRRGEGTRSTKQQRSRAGNCDVVESEPLLSVADQLTEEEARCWEESDDEECGDSEVGYSARGVPGARRQKHRSREQQHHWQRLFRLPRDVPEPVGGRGLASGPGHVARGGSGHDEAREAAAVGSQFHRSAAGSRDGPVTGAASVEDDGTRDGRQEPSRSSSRRRRAGGPPLSMSPSSTEYLDMDKSDDVSHKNRGLYVSHKCIAVCVVLVVAALAIVGISTKLLTENAEQGPAKPAEPIKPAPPLPKNVRLPRSLVPVHYDVELTPTLEGNFTFNGSVAILVLCASETWNVTLHIKDLNVSDVSVSESDAAGGSRLEHDRHDEDKRLQFLVIKLKRPLTAGSNYTVRMNFIGLLNDDLAGFYRSSYVDASGHKRFVLAHLLQMYYAAQSWVVTRLMWSAVYTSRDRDQDRRRKNFRRAALATRLVGRVAN